MDNPCLAQGTSLALIAAVATNGVIGHQGKLPWRLPKDLRYFHKVTRGHPILMGRKTFSSIGRLLTGRTNIVLSTQQGFHLPPGGLVARHMHEALALAQAAPGGQKIFIIGGTRLYQEALPWSDELYLTQVNARPKGDTFFPPIDRSAWVLDTREDHPCDEQHAFSFSFAHYFNKHTHNYSAPAKRPTAR